MASKSLIDQVAAILIAAGPDRAAALNAAAELVAIHGAKAVQAAAEYVQNVVSR